MFSSAVLTAFLFASSSLVAAAPFPILAINASTIAMITAAVNLPNTTQTNNATWFYQNGVAGACGLVSANTDIIVGLPLEFYNSTGTVSPYCGAYVVVTNVLNNLTVTARVADGTNVNNTLSMSVAARDSLHGVSDGLGVVTWVFANSTQTAAAKASVMANQPIIAAASASANAAASFASAASSMASVSAASASASASSSSAAAASASASASAQAAAAEASASASAANVAAYAAPSPTYEAPAPAYTPPTSAYTSPAPAYTPPASSDSYSGMATYYYQNGAAGACGNYNSDSSYIVAIDSDMYNGGANCGRQVRISTSSGASVTATVADMCPSCVSSGSLDLSVAAFNALASESVGTMSITWSFV